MLGTLYFIKNIIIFLKLPYFINKKNNKKSLIIIIISTLRFLYYSEEIKINNHSQQNYIYSHIIKLLSLFD